MVGDQLSRENRFQQAVGDWETLMVHDVVSKAHGKSLWMMPVGSFIVILNLIAN
jgi:hypothetical protein